MNHFSAKGTIAGEPISFNFNFKETIDYYRTWLVPAESDTGILTVPWSDFEERSRIWDLPINAYMEYDLSMYRAGDVLIRNRKCILHGAAFLWKERAFIFMGPSGVGKSTQLGHWLTLWENETTVMNGDKPILQPNMDGGITVLPSPWRGKEMWGSDSLTAPLGGIIVLEQGAGNSIERLDGSRLACYFLRSIFASFESRETIHSACGIVDEILQSVPVWRLVNTGDAASALLTRETMLKDGIFDAL